MTTRSKAPLAARPLDRNGTRCAALFVQSDGCYAGRPDIDAWPEQRDARRYAGPLPVVVHPPCQLWGAMAAVSYSRWGGEHNRPGNDGGCFAAALDSVRRFGGVLEHPAKTRAWAACGLGRPARIGWQMTIDGGKAPTGTELTRRSGFTTTARARQLICAVRDRMDRTRSVFTTSAERPRTSRPLASERRTPCLWSLWANWANCCPIPFGHKSNDVA